MSGYRYGNDNAYSYGGRDQRSTENGYGYGYGSYLAPRRRRRHWLRGLLITLAVLLVLLIVADRVGVIVADNMVADKVERSENLTSKPSVSIGGFPFLTQLASRDFTHVSATADNVQRDTVTITKLHVDMSDVRVNSGFTSARVAQLTGSAFLNYAAVSDAIRAARGPDVTVGPASNGMVTVSGMMNLPVLGRVKGAVLATLSIRPGNQIAVKAVKLATPIPGVQGLGSGIAQALDVTIPLNDLPFQMTLRSIDVGSSGVTIAATSDNVQLSSAAAGQGNNG